MSAYQPSEPQSNDYLGDFEGYRSDPHYDNGGSPQ